MNECFVCSEPFNNTIHMKINCPYCNFEACRECCQTYILDKENSICMNVNKKENGDPECQRQWSRKFIVDNFPGTWINSKWKNMIEKTGLDREKALLPATMPELYKRREDNKIYSEIQKIKNEIKILYDKQRVLVNQKRNNNENENNSNRHFRGRPCSNESCRGFLSSQWKCNACDMWTCPECHQLKGYRRDIEHTCKPDDLATAKMMNKETKPCPSCNTPIFKIMGCDQMWCTQCHTGFSWRTGIIQNSHIHNPHYFEWQRQNNNGIAPRNQGDIECGRDLSDPTIIFKIRSILVANCASFDVILKDYVKKFEYCIRGTLHLDRIQAPRFRVNNVQNNLDLRLQYLEKNIDEDKFRVSILRRSKANEKKQDIYNVIQLLVQTITDIIYRFHDELNNIDDTSSTDIVTFQMIQKIRNVCEKHYNEITAITDYCNNLLKQHQKTYGCKLYRLDFNKSSIDHYHNVLV